MRTITINNRIIGENHLPLVIAEIGINHEGSIETAFSMVDSAIRAGAEFIKFQTHIIDEEMSPEAKKFIPGNAKESIYEIMKRCVLSQEEEYRLAKYIKSKNTTFISTPFSKRAVDRLIKINVPCFKIGSGECNNLDLISYISKFKKPIIMSTGMNDLNSIKESVNIIEKRKIPLAILHCTNVYPTPYEIIRLNAITELKNKFKNNIIGYSDHAVGITPCLSAVTLGAKIIEKHYTDFKHRPGPDISCSMDEVELFELKKNIQIIFDTMKGNLNSVKEENITKKFAFSTAVATKNLHKGHTLKKGDIKFQRPQAGDYLTKDLNKILNKKLSTDIKQNEHFKKNHFK
tara:strand:+ start:1848 stop:2885 length:1038 start_codon:yes stop_codon:yes gene_type:complete